MVESCVFTKEKMQAMGIPEGIVPEGWWIGFYVEDDEAWEKVKDGTYQMFSIEGQGIREEVEETEDLGKSDIDKFNPYHDKIGRFTSGNGGKVYFFTTQTKDPNKQHWADKAIYRAKYKDYESKNKAYEQAKQELDNAKTISEKAKLHDKFLAAAKDAYNAKQTLDNHKDLQPKVKDTTKPPASGKPKTTEKPLVSEKPKTTGSNTTDPNDPKYLNKKKQTNHLPEQKLSENKAIEITQKQTGTNYETAKRITNAVYDFSGSQYGAMRSAYAKGDTTSEAGKKAQALDEFVDKSPKWGGGTLYRGIGVTKEVADDIIKQAEAGKTLNQKGPSSWTTNESTGKAFGGGPVHITFITNGTTAKHGTSIKHLSQFPGEKEVLMSGKAKQKPTKVVKNTDNDYYFLFYETTFHYCFEFITFATIFQHNLFSFYYTQPFTGSYIAPSFIS
jgi:hypothetical protein